MKYLVLVKQVPDVSEISVDMNGNLIRKGVPSILNPYCEYAMDLACRIRTGEDTIIVATMGPPQAESALFRCLELGADEAYLLSDRDFAGADTFSTSTVLAAFIGKYAPDSSLIFCGKQAVDGDTAQVPSELAALLGRDLFCYCEDLSISDGMTAVENYGTERMVCRVPPGSVVSVSKGDTNRRLPSISDHIAARSKKIIRLGRDDLGLDPSETGMKGSKTRIVRSFSSVPARRGETVDGTDPKHAADIILNEVRG